MSITITLPEEIDIDSYGGLQAFLIRHLQLSDDTIERLPTLIRLGEVRLARLLTTPWQETSTTLATQAGQQAVSLPTDFDQSRQLKILGDDGYPLAFVTPNVVEGLDYPGKPYQWAIYGDSILLGPVPDSVYTLTLRYSARLPFLTDNAASNWLLARNPDAYITMCSAIICDHIGDAERAGSYIAQAGAIVEEINRQGNRRRWGGPMRLRSPVVV